MRTLIANDFAAYELTDEEVIQGCILSFDQKCVIQNRISILAHEKIELELDPNAINNFLQREAYLRGSLDELKFLQDNSDASEEAIRVKAGHPTEPEV